MHSPPTVFVTGATDGLGRALVDRLAAEGARLILHGRDRDKLGSVANEVAAAHGTAPPTTAVAHLADLADVARLAATVRGGTERLDAFVSNAGIGSGEPDGRTRRTSADGHELRFAVNYLAGFLLTHELIDLLHASAPARIVNVASLGQAPLDFDDLMLEHDYSGGRAYAQSKLAQIMSGIELAHRLPDAAVTVNSLHPGTYMPTKIVLNERGSSVDELATGVESTSRLVLDPELADVTGAFFDRTQPALANAQAYDTDARRMLWDRSVDLVRPHLSEPAA